MIGLQQRTRTVDIVPIARSPRFLVRAALVAVTALAATAVAWPAAGAQVTPSVTEGRYIALGDSFSSGEGVPVFVRSTDIPGVNECHRSYRAYPELVVGQPGTPSRLLSGRFACSGATVGSFLRGQWNEPPQLERLDALTTLVTMTLGGNDVGFTEEVLRCLVKARCDVLDGARVAQRTQGVGAALAKLYKVIAGRAPAARVLIVGYPRLFPSSPTRSCSPGFGTFDASEQRWINYATARLNQVIASGVAAVGQSRVLYVDTFDVFRGRELCGGGTAMNGVNVRHPIYSIHPTALGQSLLAGRVLAAARAA